MAVRDIGHEQTDEVIAQLAEKIKEVYKKASKDMEKEARTYFEKFESRDEEMKARIGVDISEEDYKQWRLNQIGRGKRFEALRDKLAERMNEADEIAIKYMNEAVPSVYSLNRNYAAYTIESAGYNIDFTLWDERQVRTLIKEHPDLMPNYPKAKAIKRGINLEYGQKMITKNITSGILQGISVKKMAYRLAEDITNMGMVSATRAIRTGMTAAESSARADEYIEAEDMGIEIEQEWRSVHDFRTRASHGAMDGVHIKVGQKFKLQGCELAFPADPSGADPSEIYNCRCTLAPWFPELKEENDARMKYSEWLKQKQADMGADYITKSRKEYYAKQKQNREPSRKNPTKKSRG